jgi:hypothetical protein
MGRRVGFALGRSFGTHTGIASGALAPQFLDAKTNGLEIIGGTNAGHDAFLLKRNAG